MILDSVFVLSATATFGMSSGVYQTPIRSSLTQ